MNCSCCIYSNRFLRSSVPGFLAVLWSLLFDVRLRCFVEDDAEFVPCATPSRFALDESVGVDNDDLLSAPSLMDIVVGVNTAASRFSLLLTVLMCTPARPSKLNLDEDKISSTLILLLLAASLLLLLVKLLPLLVVFLLRVLTAGLAGGLVAALTKLLTPRRSEEDIRLCWPDDS